MTAQPLAQPNRFASRLFSGALVSPPVLDLLFGASALFVLLFFLFQIFKNIETSLWLMTIPPVLLSICNYPHYAATYYRVYRRKEDIIAYWPGTILAPACFLVVAAATIMMPGLLAPWFCKLMFLTGSYHYSGQSFGFALLYAGKSGIKLTKAHRNLIAALFYATFWRRVIDSDVHDTAVKSFSGFDMPSLYLPMWLFYVIEPVFWATIVLYVAFNIWLFKKNGKALPMLTQLVVLSYLWWWVFGISDKIWWVFVPTFHCAQYLLITTLYQVREQLIEKNMPADKGLDRFKTIAIIRYWTVLIVLGNLMFIALPWGMSQVGVCSLDVANAVLITIWNLHHFVLDGLIWPLKDPKIRMRLAV